MKTIEANDIVFENALRAFYQRERKLAVRREIIRLAGWMFATFLGVIAWGLLIELVFSRREIIAWIARNL